MALDALLDCLSPGQRNGLKRALAVIPSAWRQRPVYRRWRRFLDEAQFWPRERIVAWQLEKLRDLIRLAVTQTDGYRELYARAGVKPEDIRSLDDVRKLPFTTKEMFRDQTAAFTIRQGGGRYVTTGGSTGIPFGFHELPETSEIEKAFMHTGWAWMGWQQGQGSAVLRGGFIGTEMDFAAYDPFHRQLALSSYFLTARNVAQYLDAIRQAGLRVLQAYPSSLNLLCDLVKEQRLQGKLELDLILLGSENVYDWQLEKFEQTFPKAKFFSWYGHCEKAVLAPWCEHTRQFHSWPFYGLTEIINPDGSESAEGGEGEIVGTSFHQRVTPFIRYRTMDRAVKGPSACSGCGRQFPILSRIAGRSHEVIVTASGRYISMTAINMHDDIFDALRQFQFRQEKPGEVTFQYVAKAGALPETELAKIRNGLQLKLGSDTKLALHAVDEIPRTKAGKYRFLDQRLPIHYGDR